jgi:hypothetical protein
VCVCVCVCVCCAGQGKSSITECLFSRNICCCRFCFNEWPIVRNLLVAFGLEATETPGNRLTKLLRHFLWGVFRMSVPHNKKIFPITLYRIFIKSTN